MAEKFAALLLVTCVACGGQSTDLVDDGTGGSSGSETGDTAGDDDDETSAGGPGVGGTKDSETGGADGAGGDQGSGGDEPSSGGAASGGTSSGGAESSGGTSSGGAPDDSIPLSEMKLTAKLSENATCWQDNFPDMGCTEIPDYEPAVIEWMCDETMAKVLVPPGVCLRISGRFALSSSVECRLDPSAGCRVDEPDQDESRITNTTDEVIVRYIHRRKDCDLFWTAWWYAEECPEL